MITPEFSDDHSLTQISNRLRVLHVTECYEGGVGAAVDSLISHYEAAEHGLVWFGARKVEDNPGIAADYELPEGFIGRWTMIRRAVDDFKPDVVHAHSSWAGVLCRALPLGVPVVYEPHCFVFDDPARSANVRRIYQMAEKVLARRSAVTIVLSEHERSLAEGLRPAGKIMDLANIPTIKAWSGERSFATTAPMITMVGRIADQKDPRLFAHVAGLVLADNPDVRFTWIGDGDPAQRSILENAGVRVTGWLSHEAVRDELIRSSIYFHSAAYEGFPLSVLDAAASGLPIIARDLPCFIGTGLATAKDAESIAATLRHWTKDEQAARDAAKASRNLLQSMNVEVQRGQLGQIYAAASGRLRADENYRKQGASA